jgi:hypothetical protein
MSSVDDSGFQEAMNKINLTGLDLLKIEGSGAAVIVNQQKIMVAKDTTATEKSIQRHVTTATVDQVVDEIGPETGYAPNIEYGRRDMPNFPIQPYVRPSVAGENFTKVIRAIGTAFGKLIETRWPT